ncbi:MAG: serine/threonine-protein phosphatase [Chromatiaceae bacterium]|nr:serine/threonine-protein phosphatase [Chromatiaceae bacterium]
MTIRSVVRSDKGLVREINEDSVGVLSEQGLVVLTDGMGGHCSGEVASRLAVAAITRLISSHPTASPATAIKFANHTILEKIREDAALNGMATTAVVGRFHDGVVEYAHVGDSRLYLWRDSRLRKLTRDHSMIQELVDEGVYASLAEARREGIRNNLLTRGVGIGDDLTVDSGSLTLHPGDRFLFCSDGLSNMLSDKLIGRLLATCSDSLESAADLLLGLALKRGGYDNISVALVESTEPEQAEGVDV